MQNGRNRDDVGASQALDMKMETLMLVSERTENDSDLFNLATQINAAHIAIGAAFQEGIAYAVEAGGLLLEAKSILGHGNWLPWLRANVHFSARNEHKSSLFSRSPVFNAKGRRVI